MCSFYPRGTKPDGGMAFCRSPSKVGQAIRVGSSSSPEERVGRGQNHFNRSPNNRRRREPRVGALLLRDYPRFTPNATYTVIVKRLPLNITEHQLSSVFGHIGPVSGTKIIKSPTPTNNVYGFVHYTYFNDAKKAVSQLNGTMLNGSKISIEFAKTDGHYNNSHGNTTNHAVEIGQWSEGQLLQEKMRYTPRHGVLLNQTIPKSMIDKFNKMNTPFQVTPQSNHSHRFKDSMLTTKSATFSDSCARDSGYISVGTNIVQNGINAHSSSSTSSSPVTTLTETTNIKMDSNKETSLPVDNTQVDDDELDLPPLECPELDSNDDNDGICSSPVNGETPLPLLDCSCDDHDQENVCIDEEMPPLESHHSDSACSSVFHDLDTDEHSEDDETFLSDPAKSQPATTDAICTLKLPKKELPVDNHIIPLSGNMSPSLSTNHIAAQFSSHNHIPLVTPPLLTSNNITSKHLPSHTQTTPPLKIGRGKMLLDLLQQMSIGRSPRTQSPSIQVSHDLNNDTTPSFETCQTAGRMSPGPPPIDMNDSTSTAAVHVHSEESDCSKNAYCEECPLLEDTSKHSPARSEPISVPAASTSSPLQSSLLADSSSIRPSTSPEEQPADGETLPLPVTKTPSLISRGFSSSVSPPQQQQQRDSVCESSLKSLRSCEDGVSSSEEEDVEHWGTRFGRDKDEMEKSVSTLERNIHRLQAELRRLQQKNVAMTKELEEARQEEAQIEINPELIGELPPERLREFGRILELEARLALTRETNTNREVCQKEILDKAHKRYKNDKLAFLELELAVKAEEVKWYLELAKQENKMLQAKADFYLNYIE